MPRYASVRGIDIVAVYGDAAVSGATAINRQQLQRLLVDAKTKRFQAVIVDDLSRLSRDRVDSGVLVRQLDDLGVSVIDCETGGQSDDEASEMVFGVKALINGEFVKTIRRQTHRGLEGRALAGFHTGGKTYGYTSVIEPNPSDPTKPRRLPVVDEAEAEVVTRIFETFAAGRSPRDIAQQLNAEAVPAPHGGGKGFKGARGWAHTTIRAMMRNRRYTGEVVWNAHRWKKTAKGTRRRIARPASEHVTKTYPQLAIIGPELWERVQQRLGARRKAGGPVTPRTGSTFALSGLLRCGFCGGNFTVVSQVTKAGTKYRNLGCVAHKDHRCDNAKTISERKVMNALVTQLRERLSRPDRVEVFVEAFRQRCAELEAEGSPTKELEDKIERQRQLLANITQALVTVPGSKTLGEKLAVEEAGSGGPGGAQDGDSRAPAHPAPPRRDRVLRQAAGRSPGRRRRRPGWGRASFGAGAVPHAYRRRRLPDAGSDRRRGMRWDE